MLAVATLVTGCVSSGTTPSTRVTKFEACKQQAQTSADPETAVSECHWAIPRGGGGGGGGGR